MKDPRIIQLADIYVKVSRGEMSQLDFFLAFRSRYEDQVVNAFQRWSANHSGWDTLDWSRIEADPLLSQLLSPKIKKGTDDTRSAGRNWR
jgi:hypothetical protein